MSKLLPFLLLILGCNQSKPQPEASKPTAEVRAYCTGLPGDEVCFKTPEDCSRERSGIAEGAKPGQAPKECHGVEQVYCVDVSWDDGTGVRRFCYEQQAVCKKMEAGAGELQARVVAPCSNDIPLALGPEGRMTVRTEKAPE